MPLLNASFDWRCCKRPKPAKNQEITLQRGQVRYDPFAAFRRYASSVQHGNDQSLRQPKHSSPGALPDGWRAGGGQARSNRRSDQLGRIVTTPGGITVFYDVGQGQGWQRNIVMDGSPRVPAPTIRQWYGNSRGRWEGNTLVIDVTNFNPKTDFQGSRENLHVIERWTRTGPNSLEYTVTVEDPTVWTRPWTAKQEFIRQVSEENRIYTEPRCIEGNYGLPGINSWAPHGRPRLRGRTRC